VAKPEKSPPAKKRAAGRAADRVTSEAASADASRPSAKPPRPAFPKKSQPPSDAEFAARLPVAVGRKLEAIRAFLTKQRDVEESWHYYGPKSGWAYRYLRGDEAIATILLHGGVPTAVLALDAAAQAGIDWQALSDVGRRAQRLAHGTPALLWLDVPLDGAGVGDVKKLVKAKLAQPGASVREAPTGTAALSGGSKKKGRGQPQAARDENGDGELAEEIHDDDAGHTSDDDDR